MKKGFVFTMDILLGIIISISILLTFNFIIDDFELGYQEYQNLAYRSQDIINLLSTLKLNEIEENPKINKLFSEGILKEEDMEKNILDISTSLFYSGNKTLASEVIGTVIENVSKDVCVQVLVFSESIYSSCNTTGEDYFVSTKIETGYEIGKPVEGFIARASISSISGKYTNSYVYFGGYEGEGNITKIIDLPPFVEISEVYMEVDSGNNFTLYINGNFSGIYNKTNNFEMLADKWIVDPIYYTNFIKGENLIRLNFTGLGYIGGGFIRVTYQTKELSQEEFENKYFFPGIEGFINVYSSFFVPGNLNGLSVHLHYKSNYTTFLNIAGFTVYRNNTTEENRIDIGNSTISTLLDFRNLSGKTIPVRLGTEGFTTFSSGNADVILITDLSGTMDWRLDSGETGVSRSCTDPNLYNPSTKRISLAKCLAIDFVQQILNTTGNRIGLVGYSGVPNYLCSDPSNPIRSYHNLTNNSTSLISQINTYTPSGATGICGAIRKARTILHDQSNSSRQKFIIVMTDGLANVQCDP
ncbi:MAG: vWA domain-containing protein, partial [Candidatus Aenigmatarchaeota archaeon]